MTAAASATSLQPADNRLAQLDGLRAIAIAMVMVAHLLPVPRPMAVLGHWGVSLFFVLSGFLITRILLDLRQQSIGGSLKAFYARRALRILPPYYLLLAVVWLLDVRKVADRIGWHAAYLSNYMFTAGETGGFDRHLWSLSVEEQFYLAWPWLMLLLPVRVLPMVFVACIGIAAGWRAWAWHVMQTDGWAEGWLNYPTPVHLDLLAIGGLVGYVLFQKRTDAEAEALGSGAVTARNPKLPLRRPWVAWTALLAGLPFVIVDAATFGQNTLLDWRIWFGQTSLAVLFAGVVALVASFPCRPLAWRPIAYVGTISYGMYLVHTFTGELARRLLGRDGGGWLVGLTACGLTLLIAAGSWHLFEQPILRLKRRFPYPRP